MSLFFGVTTKSVTVNTKEIINAKKQSDAI
jgi:hypothetical protein